MARVDELQAAVAVQNPEKHRGVAAQFGVLAKKTVDVVEHARWIRAKAHAGERALEHRGEQRCAEALPADVGDQESRAVVAHWEYIEVIAPDREAREIDPAHGEVRIVTKSVRQQRLLDLAGDVELLLHALPLALALDQTGVVQDAGRFERKRVQNLPIEPRERRRPRAVQI